MDYFHLRSILVDADVDVNVVFAVAVAVVDVEDVDVIRENVPDNALSGKPIPAHDSNDLQNIDPNGIWTQPVQNNLPDYQLFN